MSNSPDRNSSRRHDSLERYRPGALRNREEVPKEEQYPLPREHGQEPNGRWQRGRGGGGGFRGRGGGRRGRGGWKRDDAGPLENYMEELSLREDSGDLRSRLNQRARDPELATAGSSGRKNHSRVQGRGVGGNIKHERNSNSHFQQQQQLSRPIKRNTENFNPSHSPAEMRVLVARAGSTCYDRPITSRDVIVGLDMFCSPGDLNIYESLLKEIKNSGVDEDRLWQLWHGDSHVIADDKTRWKDSCPTFQGVLNKIRDYFDMDIKATRFNWYRSSDEWKPFHHDAAAVKPDKARSQNFTVGVSFGMERDAAFEHARTKTTLSMPQPNGTVYAFAKDVNVLWRHGIPQVPPEKYSEQGRISIIAWGWVDMTDA